MNIDSRKLIRHGNKLYLQLRTYPEPAVLHVTALKDYLGADICLRHNGVLYFCSEIVEPIDVEYLNDSLV